MDKVIDYSNCPPIPRRYGGSDRKFAIRFENEYYMIKFSENHAKHSEISTSYVNNVVSEYISSHIAKTLWLPVHETYLGTYNDEIVVACKDFRGRGDENVEFQDLLMTMYDSKDSRKYVKLDQVYSVYNNKNLFSDKLRSASVARFWDTFILDALVGNFDRHTGNWGFLSNDGYMRLAPIYDMGSTLLPQLSDEGVKLWINDKDEIIKRCLVFPSPVMYITDKKVGKVGYYDMLSSNYDSNCTEALLRMFNRIKMKDIYDVIYTTPFITDIRKEFYVRYLTARKEVIIDRAYGCCINRKYDTESYNRIVEGRQLTDKDSFVISKNYDLNNTHYEEEKRAAYSEYYSDEEYSYSLDR